MRAKIYLGILLTILLIAQFIQMFIGASVLFSSTTTPKSAFFRVLKYKTELIADLSKNNISTSAEQDTFLTLQDDEYLLIHNREKKITLLQVIDGISIEMDSIPFYETHLPLMPYEKLSLVNFEWMNYLQDSLKSTPRTEIVLSPKDLLNKIEAADKVQALVSQQGKPKELSWFSKLFFSPIFGPLFLLIVCLFIWGGDKLTTLISGILKQPKWLIFGSVFSLFILWDTWRLSQIHYNSLLTKQLDWSILLTGQIIVSLLFIPSFFLFFYFKRNYFYKMDFADGEALKFGYIFILWSILSVLHGYLEAQIYQYLNPDIYDLQVWLSRQRPAFALLLATGNFLNNFRKHYYQLKAKEKTLGDAKKNELESEAALAALQSRVNPHFLYNALNSIASLAKEDGVKTEKMAVALAKFYKYTTNRKEEHWTSIVEELDLLDTYLEIEKIRFGEQLIVKYQLDTSINNQRIPRFLLQPLVENAIKYGYNEMTNQTEVIVDIESQKDLLQISVKDKGIPFSDAMELGYGLRSVQKKLKLLYPNQHELDFVNNPEKGVIITLTQPNKTL